MSATGELTSQKSVDLFVRMPYNRVMNKSIYQTGLDIINGFWLRHDTLRELEQICKRPEGQQLYRRDALYWKTKALIVTDKTAQLKELLVQDRKTGELYDPQEKFDELMNKPEIMDVMKRLKVR